MTLVRDMAMSDEALRAAVSQFLKAVNFTAQREIEKALRNAISSGELKGYETFTAAVTVASGKVGLNVTIYNTIQL
jgi:hypothetical protein